MPSPSPRAFPEGLTRGADFSLLRLSGFAASHRHAFVLKGAGGGALFKPQPVPREAIVAAIGLPGASLHLARQVHGAGVLEVPSQQAEPAAGAGERPAPARDTQAPPEEADALIARAPGHAAGVATADCLPILLATEEGACAAVHAGWRGLLAGVIEAALARLGGHAVQAAIGPAIGPCCFEVGPDVALRFTERFPDAPGLTRQGASGKSRVDLPAAALAVLREGGVDPSQVRRADLCTRCGPPELLESYRRDGKAAGRMIALIGRA